MSEPEIIQGQLPTPNLRCPRCDGPADGYTGAAGRGPKPGDLCVCAYCAAPLVYTAETGLRLLAEEDYAALELDTLMQLMAMMNRIAEMRWG